MRRGFYELHQQTGGGNRTRASGTGIRRSNHCEAILSYGTHFIIKKVGCNGRKRTFGKTQRWLSEIEILHLFRFIKRSNSSLRQSPPCFTLSKISLSIWVQSYDTTTHCFCVSEKSFGEHTNFSKKASFPLYPYTWNSIRGKSYCSNKGSVKTE